MAKVHPSSSLSLSSSSSSSSSSLAVAPPPPPNPSSCTISSKRELFTVWMKSLVLNGNGCTIYDSSGHIVYRVDNYNYKCRSEVYVMDLYGKVLLKIHKKKLEIFGAWEVYRCNGSQQEEMAPWFRVKKTCGITKRNHLFCRVRADAGHLMCYKIVMLSKSSYKILDLAGGLVAEVKRKQATSGVALGDDVLSLAVEPNTDQSLIMGIVVVYGLMSYSM